MRRVYIGTDAYKSENIFFIKGETYHYLKNVLRLKIGNVFIGFDGSGKEYEIEIMEIKKGVIIGKIKVEIQVYFPETEFNLNLFQCIPKSEKFEFIIRETTQLGIKRIVPVLSKRVIVKIQKERIENKINRWEKIAKESAKVSGRTFIPEISKPAKFEDCIKEPKDYGIIFWEGERKNTIKDFFRNLNGDSIKNKKINVFIGPEGGFDKEEIEIAKNYNYFVASLGKRILKVETASVISIGILIYELENLYK
ncbi:MAG: 16S rRNA (uracil(1498)-N(3))-methyltransferase [Candidatus Omnitrophica bacterium]|nr:16S rRNA (uracil(1498)-N(3))-methyltransferase [Candidatus Omnitrophota bacterium]